MALDEHGRLVSEDGWYVWNGQEWLLRTAPAAMPPPVASAAMQAPVAAMPPPVASGDGQADVEAEAATYTGTRRLQRGGIRALATVLEPGERLLATAYGTIQKAPGLALAGGVAAAALAQRGLVVAATDRRLVLAVLNATGKRIDALVAGPYDQVVAWSPDISRLGAVLVVRTADGNQLVAFQFSKEKLQAVDAVVGPRVAATARGAGTAG